MRLGSFFALCSLAASLSLSLGCADASGRFDDFEARRGEMAGDAGSSPGGMGGADDGCHPPAPGLVRGPALLSLETSAGLGSPILFFGELETPELDGKTAVKFSYKALAVEDRQTLVGDPLVVGPYVIEPDGSFDAPTEESTLPGSANAVLPGVPITSQLTLHGRICGVSEFYCGTVTGTVSAPIQGDATGQFGIALVPSLEQLPSRPRYGCAEDALADPLE